MGYYSEYSLDCDRKQYATILYVISDVSGYDNPFESYDVKWYSWREDMQKVAKLLPDFEFTVTRVGEDQPDFERLLVKNGETTIVGGEVVYGLDVEKLKGALEALESYMAYDYDSYISQHVTKKTFEEWCAEWKQDELEYCEYLRNLISEL